MDVRSRPYHNRVAVAAATARVSHRGHSRALAPALRRHADALGDGGHWPRAALQPALARRQPSRDVLVQHRDAHRDWLGSGGIGIHEGVPSHHLQFSRTKMLSDLPGLRRFHPSLPSARAGGSMPSNWRKSGGSTAIPRVRSARWRSASCGPLGWWWTPACMPTAGAGPKPLERQGVPLNHHHLRPLCRSRQRPRRVLRNRSYRHT